MNEKIYFKKIINPFKAFAGGKLRYQVFMTIRISKIGNNKYPDFAISGVHGALPSGNAHGSCGQIIDNFINDDTKVFNKGWNQELYLKLVDLWKENHLHDVKDDKYFKRLTSLVEKFPIATNECSWNL